MDYPNYTGCFLSGHYLSPFAVGGIQTLCDSVIDLDRQAGTQKRLVSLQQYTVTNSIMLVTGASSSLLHPVWRLHYWECFWKRAF